MAGCGRLLSPRVQRGSSPPMPASRPTAPARTPPPASRRRPRRRARPPPCHPHAPAGESGDEAQSRRWEPERLPGALPPLRRQHPRLAPAQPPVPSPPLPPAASAGCAPRPASARNPGRLRCGSPPAAHPDRARAHQPVAPGPSPHRTPRHHSGPARARGPALRRHVTRSSSGPARGAGNRPTAGGHAGPARHRTRARRGQTGCHVDGSRGVWRGRDSKGGQRVGAGQERIRRRCCRPRSAPGHPGCAARSFQTIRQAGRHPAVTVGGLRGDARRGDCPNLSRRRVAGKQVRRSSARPTRITTCPNQPLLRKVPHVTATRHAVASPRDRVLQRARRACSLGPVHPAIHGVFGHHLDSARPSHVRRSTGGDL